MSTAPDQGTETGAESTDVRPRRKRKALLWLAIGAVVLSSSGAGYWYSTRTPQSAAAGEPTGPVDKARVTRERIAATERWNGTLGHGAPFGVTASSMGTVTRIASPGSRIRRGSVLYRVNEQPVYALYGRIPMYRDLRTGDEGADVEQLEANLAALGYDGFDVDDEFTWYTAVAVREWQDDLDAEETGVVKLSDVFFVPHSGLVDTAKVDVGDNVSPGTVVLDLTGSEQVVDLEVEVSDRDHVDVGTEVTVGLPGGKDVPGKVTSASVVEDTSGDDADTGGGETDPGADDTITEVEVTLKRKVDQALLGSPVDVVVEVEERENVLVVPIKALLALAEGGYGLEVVRGNGTTAIVPVEAGLFADGKVEVTGKGIAEGTVVGVAGR